MLPGEPGVIGGDVLIAGLSCACSERSSAAAKSGNWDEGKIVSMKNSNSTTARYSPIGAAVSSRVRATYPLDRNTDEIDRNADATTISAYEGKSSNKAEEAASDLRYCLA